MPTQTQTKFKAMKNTVKKQFPANYSNGLRHIIDTNNEQLNCKIVVSLDDDCKNGHHDFSLTATFWEPKKTRTDRNMISGGCCHDEIIKHFPALQIFADLHLSDFKGVPMYAAENGYYHLTQVSQDKFLSYYPEITAQDYEVLKTAINSADYCLKLVGLGIFKRWNEKAQKGIEMLEEMTGRKVEGVLCASVPISDEKIKVHAERMETGYYTEEATKQREEEEKQQTKEKMISKLQDKIGKIKQEMEIFVFLLEKYGAKVMDNILIYESSQKVGVNWKGYNLLPNEVVDSILSEQLPDGWSFECKNRIK